MGNLFDFLMLILSVIDISVFGNWVQMLERYREIGRASCRERV